MASVHDFVASRADGSTVPLGHYAGKLLLIVNVASKCGFTPQYEGLEEVHRESRHRGLQVLGFPCDQFMGQELDTDEEIQEFCRLTYGVTFPVFAKVEVNGPGADPLFAHLRAQAPGDFGPQYGEFYEAVAELDPGAIGTDAIKWNFTKFLVARDGAVIKRYETPVTPAEIGADIEQYL
jgi:glutathione peroxidase